MVRNTGAFLSKAGKMWTQGCSFLYIGIPNSILIQSFHEPQAGTMATKRPEQMLPHIYSQLWVPKVCELPGLSTPSTWPPTSSLVPNKSLKLTMSSSPTNCHPKFPITVSLHQGSKPWVPILFLFSECPIPVSNAPHLFHLSLCTDFDPCHPYLCPYVRTFWLNPMILAFHSANLLHPLRHSLP